MMQTATGIGARDTMDIAGDRMVAQAQLLRTVLGETGGKDGKPQTPAGANEVSKESKAEMRAKIREASQRFEAFFLNLIMSSMRKTVKKSELLSGGRGEEMFTSMFDQKITEQAAGRKDGVGIANMIYDQILKSPRFKHLKDPSKRSADTTTGTSGGSTGPHPFVKKYGAYRAAEGPKGKTVDVVSDWDSRGNSGPLPRGGRNA